MPRKSVKDWSPRDVPVKVIFRKHPGDKALGGDDEIVAVFPEIPSTPNPATCLIYVHFGQHGTADCTRIMASTVPAKPEEYESLKRELENRGYWLEIRKRITRAMDEARRAELEGDR